MDPHSISILDSDLHWNADPDPGRKNKVETEKCNEIVNCGNFIFKNINI